MGMELSMNSPLLQPKHRFHASARRLLPDARRALLAATAFGLLLLAWKAALGGSAGPWLALGLLLAFAAALDPRRGAPGDRRLDDETRLQAQAWLEMPDPALVFDHRGVVLSVNQALSTMLDLAPGLPSDLRLTQVLGDGPGPRLESLWLLETLEHVGRAQGFEIALSHPGGGTITLEGRAVRLGDPERRQYVLVWRDVSDKARRARALEERLDRLEERYLRQTGELAQKVEALGRANRELQELDHQRADLISLVSHQVRAPLTNMLGAVERMQTGCSAPLAVCEQMFSVIRGQASRLNRLVGDVLSLARLESGDLALHIEPISLLPVVRQAVEQMGARGVRRFRLPYAPVLPLVMADRDRLMEVLVNLFDNADKYSPASGEIVVDVRATETEVVLTVLDSGSGLPPQDLERIFDKFYRAEAGDAQRAYGYGLGLYICRRLIEAQGGRIWATNSPEGGARFSFTLPVASK